MEAYVAQATEEGKDLKTPVEVVAHVLPKLTFLRNVAAIVLMVVMLVLDYWPYKTCGYCAGCTELMVIVLVAQNLTFCMY
ncbi:unnamed protein product [Urochloa humidicola]